MILWVYIVAISRFVNSWHMIDNSWLILIDNILGLLLLVITLLLWLMMNGNPLFRLARSLLNDLMNRLCICLFVKEIIMRAFVHVLMLNWPKLMIFLMSSVSWGKMQVSCSRLKLITVMFFLVIILVLM